MLMQPTKCFAVQQLPLQSNTTNRIDSFLQETTVKINKTTSSYHGNVAYISLRRNFEHETALLLKILLFVLSVITDLEKAESAY